MKRDKILEDMEGGGNIQRLQDQLAKVDNEIFQVKNPLPNNPEDVHISPQSSISEDSMDKYTKTNAAPPTHADPITPSSKRTKLTYKPSSSQSVSNPPTFPPPPPYESLQKHEIEMPALHHIDNTSNLPSMYSHEHEHGTDTSTLTFLKQHLFNNHQVSQVGNVLPPIHELFKQVDQQYK